MSEGYKTYTSEDGSLILFDANTGQYYTQEVNTTQQNKLVQYPKSKTSSKYQEGNTVPQMKPLTIQPATKVQVNTINSNQKNSKQTTMKQNNKTKNTSSNAHEKNNELEHTSTPLLSDQERKQNYKNDENEKNNESCVSIEEQQDTTISANKRGFNDSDEFITVKSNKSRRNDYHLGDNQSGRDDTTNFQSKTNGNSNNCIIPLEHIQRAVIHNLPCFTISFIGSDKLPAAVTVAEDLNDHFKQQDIQMSNGFSVVRYIGNQLKIGVNNKDDYQKLGDPRVWPSEIQGRQIKVMLPKFVPEQFALVVRFVIRDLSVDQVEKEVRRSASTANNFRAIIYHYQRATNDFRFTVTDLKEYNGLVKLGHIGVGNKMCPVTLYKPANKLTFCNKCWVLGHTRITCQQQTQKCRICLENYDQNHNAICSKQYQCAQCNLDHFSLDADCKLVQQYRSSLNRAVKHAKEQGIIKIQQPDTQKQHVALPPMVDVLNFPQLPQRSGYQNSLPSAWRTNTLATASSQVEPQQTTDISNQQLFDKMCSYLDHQSEKIVIRIEKVEHGIKEAEKEVINLHQSLSMLSDIIKSLTTNIIMPLVKVSPCNDTNTKDAVDKIVLVVNDQIERLQYKLQLVGNEKAQNETTTVKQVQDVQAVSSNY